MVPIYSPRSASEQAVLLSLFEAFGVPCYVRGGAFGKLYPGLQIYGYTTQTLMVPESAFEPAAELINGFLTQPEQSEDKNKKASFWDKARIVLEAIVCGWFVPGHKWQDDPKAQISVTQNIDD